MSQVRTRHDKGVNLIPENIEGVGGEDLSIEGDLSVDSSDSELKVRLDGLTRTVVTEDQAQKLENKVIDSDKNVITNIVTDDLKAGVLNVDPSLSGATDVQIPSAKAVKEYVDTSSGQVQADVDDLITLSGVPANSTDLGSFTGVVIPDGQTVKEALQSLETASESNSNLILDVSQDLQDHVNNPTGAHAASAISVTPTGTIGSTNVQSAIQELDADIQVDRGTLLGHISSSNNVHGVVGNVVGTTDTQTLTNKTLDLPVINQGISTGLTIENPSRAGVREDTKLNLITYALGATNGQLVFATDEKRMYQVIDGLLAPIGGSGGGGLDTYYTQSMEDLNDTSDFAKGNSPSFMGGGVLNGSLTIEELQPIAGAKSLKYTQGASSVNDYFASPIIHIDPKQQGNTSGMTFYFEYDGNDNDGRFIVYDVDNAREISSEVNFVKKEGIATRYQLSFWVPENCSQIRWGYKVLVANSGKSLVMDDVEMSTNPFMYKDLTVSQQLGYTVSSLPISSPNKWGSSTVNKGAAIITYNNVTGYFTATIKCEVSVTFRAVNLTSGFPSISIVGTEGSVSSQHLQNANGRVGNTSLSFILGAGQTFFTSTTDSAVDAILTISATATTEHVLTPSDTFSTDTAPLTWAAPAQYNLTTLENAPIGTYITFQYAANTNTRTQCTTRPTQTDASMNVNGMQIFARAYNTASTAASPAVIAIQIGKGMKGTSLGLYKSAGKVTSGSLDYVIPNSTIEFGAYTQYNESTGIMLIDAGIVNNTTTTSHSFQFSDVTAQANGYLTINAGRTLPLLAVPTPLVAYLKDVKPSGTSGGTFTAGAWQTRTLNTVEGDSSIVSLNANQFTLGPGKFKIRAIAPSRDVDVNKIRLYKVTTGEVLIEGTSSANLTIGVQGISTIEGTIYLNASTTMTIQHRCSTSRSDIGFGTPTSLGSPEVYTVVVIEKIG